MICSLHWIKAFKQEFFLDFISAFDSVNHTSQIFKFQSIGQGGLLLNILKQFLLNRQMGVVVDGFYSSFQCPFE